jgi:hypothetical protein
LRDNWIWDLEGYIWKNNFVVHQWSSTHGKHVLYHARGKCILTPPLSRCSRKLEKKFAVSQKNDKIMSLPAYLKVHGKVVGCYASK